jgi:hypothetical protein
MVSFIIHGSDAFLQGQQTALSLILPFVNLSPFDSSLPVVALCVLGSLTTSQIHQNQLTYNFLTFPDINLADGVGTRTGIVGSGCMGCAICVGLLHDAQKVFCTFSGLLGQTWNLNIAILVLHNVEQGLLIEQVQASTSIDLEICNIDHHFLSYFKHLTHQLLLKPIHRESFT